MLFKPLSDDAIDALLLKDPYRKGVPVKFDFSNGRNYATGDPIGMKNLVEGIARYYRYSSEVTDGQKRSKGTSTGADMDIPTSAYEGGELLYETSAELVSD